PVDLLCVPSLPHSPSLSSFTHRLPPSPTLFPYTTLFRSSHRARGMALLGGSMRLGILIGPLLGAGLIHLLGVRSVFVLAAGASLDRKSTRLNSSHVKISYAVFCLKKKRYRDYEKT